APGLVRRGRHGAGVGPGGRAAHGPRVPHRPPRWAVGPRRRLYAGRPPPADRQPRRHRFRPPPDSASGIAPEAQLSHAPTWFGWIVVARPRAEPLERLHRRAPARAGALAQRRFHPLGRGDVDDELDALGLAAAGREADGGEQTPPARAVLV